MLRIHMPAAHLELFCTRVPSGIAPVPFLSCQLLHGCCSSRYPRQFKHAVAGHIVPDRDVESGQDGMLPVLGLRILLLYHIHCALCV